MTNVLPVPSCFAYFDCHSIFFVYCHVCFGCHSVCSICQQLILHILPVLYFVPCIIAAIKSVPSVQILVLCILAAVLAVPSDLHLVLQIGSCSIALYICFKLKLIAIRKCLQVRDCLPRYKLRGTSRISRLRV